MSILSECPICKKKQSLKNKLCSCGTDLDKSKRSKKIRYWINYRLPGGKQRRELIGKSIEKARAKDGEIRAKKDNDSLSDVVINKKLNFIQLAEWFTSLEQVKAKKYFPTLEICLTNFNNVFGQQRVNTIRPADLESYQAKRKAAGYSDSYIDQDITAARTMINKAYDNDLISDKPHKTFRKVKKLLKKNSNARNRILSIREFQKLSSKLPLHLKQVVTTAFYTGMRKGEILNLTWDKVDMKNQRICLKAEDTKDSEARNIPMCSELYELFKKLPRGINKTHVFLYKGKPFTNIRSALKSGCKKADIPYGRKVKNGFTFHDLRHSFNTHMRKAGVPESIIMEITGHSTREMFDRYNTVDNEDVREAVDQMHTFIAKVDRTVDKEPKNKKAPNS